VNQTSENADPTSNPSSMSGTDRAVSPTGATRVVAPRGMTDPGDPSRGTGGTSEASRPAARNAEPVVARWRYSYINGCGEPATLTAWLEPLDPAAGLPCGAIPGEGEPLPADRLPPANTPVASVRVFETGGRCPHHAAVELSLAFPAP